MTKMLFPMLTMAAMLGACGTRTPDDSSAVNERHDIPTALVAKADADHFLTRTAAIATAQTGSLTVWEFLKIMPMKPDQRQIIANSFTDDFAVSCNAAGRCLATTQGSSASAIMHVNLGFISNPKLVLKDDVTAEFVMRGDTAVEFCNITGMAVSKLFVTRLVTGIHLETTGEAPALTVNVGDDGDNYTCE